MAAIKTLIRAEEDGTISFGDYTLDTKTKLSDFAHAGDLYKVKTFKDITRLERNELFVYESVPGTAVNCLACTEDGMSFTVEGPHDARITVEGEPETDYMVEIDGVASPATTNLGGKLSFSVKMAAGEAKQVRIFRA